MPYKTGKMKGELTTPEIRKLIKAHNILVSIKIPKGAKREDIIDLVKKNGYEINHEKQALVPKVEMQRKKTIGLEKAKEITKPKPLTEEQNKKRQQAKQKKAGEKAFLKTVIPKPPSVSKPSKGVKVGKPPPKEEPKKEEPKKEEPKKEKDVDKVASKIIVPPNSSMVKFITISDKIKTLFKTNTKDSQELKDWKKMTKDILVKRLSLIIMLDKDELDKNINNFNDIKKITDKLNKDQKPIGELMNKSEKLINKIDVNDKTIEKMILFAANVKTEYEKAMGETKSNIQKIINKKKIKPS
jgi:hypothetical protein